MWHRVSQSTNSVQSAVGIKQQILMYTLMYASSLKSLWNTETDSFNEHFQQHSYTVWSKITDPLVYFDDNFGKYGPI